MKIKTVITLFCATLFTSGCAQIKNYSNIDTPLGTTLTTPVGGKIFGIANTKDLPNVFGKADIYGGKVNTGFSELRFKGVAEDSSKVNFEYTELVIHSNENVFTRYGQDGTSIYQDQYTGNTYMTTHKKPIANITHMPPSVSNFSIPSSKKSLDFSGYKITLIDITPYQLTYSITQ